MSLRIPTRHLVGILADLSLTAASPEVAEATAAVLLHCARGHLKGEPGRTDLLVGTSTDGNLVGHTYAECYGSVEPMLWPIGEVAVVVAVLKPLAKDKEHTTEIGRDGDTIWVAPGDVDLFGERSRYTFTGLNPADFPTQGVHGLLTEIRMTPAEMDAPPVAPRTDYAPSRLVPFQKIATRRGELIQTYRWHQNLPVSVQIGPEYRGILRPQEWTSRNEAAGAAPGGDVYPILLEDTEGSGG